MPKESRLLVIASRVLRAGVGVGMLALAFGVFGYLAATRPEPARIEQEIPPLTVRAMRVEFVPIARSWDGHGTAAAMQAANVAAQVTARVVQRPQRIEVGAPVKAGDLLLQLDQTDFRQRVTAAEQALAQLRADLEAWGIEFESVEERERLVRDEVEILQREYQRAVKAREDGVGSIQEVETRLAAYTRAQREAASLRESLALMVPRRARLLADMAAQDAALALAREDLARTTIVAPFDGILQRVTGRPGELIPAGAEVARIVNTDVLEIPLRLPLSAHRFVRLGDAVEFRTDRSLFTETWHGRVIRIAPEADPASRSITVYAELRQTDGFTPRIVPGEFVVARVTSDETIPRAIVPRIAVNRERVLVAQNREGGPHRVKAVPVRVSHTIDAAFPHLDPNETQWTVIESGLEPGQIVVISNLDALEPGMAVIVSETSNGSPTEHTP